MNSLRSLKRQAANLKDTWSPQLKNKALNLGLLPGNSEYTRFIILGRSRSGSNFLRGMLNDHNKIIVFEEMFKNPNQIGWGLPGYPEDEVTLQRFQREPIQFIEQDLFTKMPKQIQAVGFKIFYYHAYGTSLEPVWGYLREHPEIRVLHIKRQNILKTLISKKRAELTNSWINLTGEVQPSPKITLDINECAQVFEQTRIWEKEYDKFFEHHPLMEVVYENLARNYLDTIHDVQQFLNVEFARVQPQTFKQARQPISEIVTNYAELKTHFLGTPWESFFID